MIKIVLMSAAAASIVMIRLALADGVPNSTSQPTIVAAREGAQNQVLSKRPLDGWSFVDLSKLRAVVPIPRQADSAEYRPTAALEVLPGPSEIQNPKFFSSKIAPAISEPVIQISEHQLYGAHPPTSSPEPPARQTPMPSENILTARQSLGAQSITVNAEQAIGQRPTRNEESVPVNAFTSGRTEVQPVVPRRQPAEAAPRATSAEVVNGPSQTMDCQEDGHCSCGTQSWQRRYGCDIGLPRSYGDKQCFTRPFGHCLTTALGQQVINGIADRMVLYHYDFGYGENASKLSLRGKAQLVKFARGVLRSGLPITVQSTPGNSTLDELRRANVLEELMQLDTSASADWVIVDKPRAHGLRGLEAIEIDANNILNTRYRGTLLAPPASSSDSSE
jgi:hypothetical protein